jgi:hypothetical protein
MRGAWARMSQRQLAPMAAWRNAELPRACPAGKTLLYPFSGPDSINACWLFPGCEAFVLFGLERVGEVPAIEMMGGRRLAKLLEDVRAATVDLFARNYFVTGKMSRQLHTEELRGVVPLLLVSMALSGVEVLRVEPFELAPSPRAGGTAADVSAFLVQDDTGLPYGMLLKRGWELRLYGRYEVPIPPFEYAYQPVLARAYAAEQPPSLAFFFGYHRNRGDDRSNVMVARRPAAHAPAPGAQSAGGGGPPPAR